MVLVGLVVAKEYYEQLAAAVDVVAFDCKKTCHRIALVYTDQMLGDVAGKTVGVDVFVVVYL